MAPEYPILDCQNLRFSGTLSQDRLERGIRVLGEPTVRRLLCYDLYLMGVNRNAIAHALDIPRDTCKSIIKAVEKEGLPAFEDRRHRTSSFLPPEPAPVVPITLSASDELVVVDFGAEDRRLEIPRQNELQVRTVLLSLCNSGLLSYPRVADVIGLTPTHTATLGRRLAEEGVSSLIDKREGQQSDYRITPDVKAEIVQQFAVDVIARGKTSGESISSELKKRCQLTIPARTVRHHLARLGLSKIKQSLPELVAELKKTSKRSS